MKYRYFEARTLGLVLTSLVVMLAMLVALPTPAFAASDSASGEVTTSSPTYSRYEALCSGARTTVHYRVLRAKIHTTSDSVLSAQLDPDGFRAHLGVYEAGFQAEYPISNCYGHTEGASPGTRVEYSTPTVTLPGSPERSYDFVVSGYSATDLGAFTLTVASSNATLVEITDVTPGPVVDTTSPVITVPGDLTREADSATGSVVTFSVSSNDAVDGPVSTTCSPASGSTFALGTTTVTCTAKDSKNNTASKAFNVTVQDTTGPSFNAPENMTLEATGPSGTPALYATPTASDLVDGGRPTSCSPASGTDFSTGTTTVNCTAVDKSGNSTVKSFTVNVQDTNGPKLTQVSNKVQEATEAGGATATFTVPTATDLVDGSLPVTCDAASGDLFPLGTTTVTCTAEDSAGNEGTTSFTVNVFDETAPTLTQIANVEAEATSPDGAEVTYTAPTATDTVDDDVAVTCNRNSGSTFPVGTTTVTCTAEDSAGNENSTSFTIAVTDTTGPTLSAVTDITREATGPDGATVTYTAPTATDTVDGDVDVTCLPASGSTFVLGETEVSCSASDSRGNDGDQQFTVTVEDTTIPAISGLEDLTERATSAAGVDVTFTGIATDLVDGDLPLTCDPASGSVFALGTTTVECTAVDAAENVATASFDIEVIKNTFTVANEVTVNGTAKVGRVLTAVDDNLTPSKPGTEATHQWLRDGDIVASATEKETYTLTGDDLGHDITHRVTFTLGGYEDVTKDSDAVGPIVKGDIVVGSTTVSGTAQVGQNLTASVADVVPSDADVTYRWLSGDDEIGVGSTYVVKPADLGARIVAEATTTRDHYEDSAHTSSPTDVVIKGLMTSTDSIALTGPTKVGATLRSTGGLLTVPLATTTTHQWYRGTEKISGADESTYVPTNADTGVVLTLRTTASRDGYEDIVSSVSTATVIDGGIITLAQPEVTGLPIVDQVLTTSVLDPAPDGVTVAHAWFVGDRAAGTGTSYTVQPRDVGEVITAQATASKTHFDEVVTTSAATAKVTPATFSTAPPTSISGVFRVGERLQAVVGTAVPAPDSVTYQWHLDGETIPGATDATFDLTPAHKNKTVSVTATALRAGYVDAPVTDTANAPVVTNLSPDLTLNASATKVRLGETTTLTWSSLDAVTLEASGDWNGSKEGSGTVQIKPSETGTATYVIQATNGSGTTTAQVAVAVALPATTLAITSKKSVRVDKKWVVRASGLDSLEAFTIRLAGKVIASGTATKAGTLKRSVTVPSSVKAGKRVLRVTGSLPDRTATRKVAIKRPQPLSIALDERSARASDVQRITVKGFFAREKVVVTYGGDRISTASAKADGRGVFTMSFRVGTSWGTKTITASAGAKGRTASASFAVTQRCFAGERTCR